MVFNKVISTMMVVEILLLALPVLAQSDIVSVQGVE